MTLVLTIAAGVLSAGIYLSLLSGMLGSFLLAYFAQLPLFAVGLMFGIGPGAIAASTGVVVALAGGGAAFALIFAIVNAAPAVFMVRQALLNRTRDDGGVVWYPTGRLVGWLCGLAVAAFAAMYVLLMGHDGGLEGVLREIVAGTFGGPKEPGATPAPGSETMLAAMQTVSRFFPGAALASWIVMTALNGALGQLIARRTGTARRPSPGLDDFELPSWIPGATAIAGLGAIAGGTPGFIGANVAMVLGLGFVFAGLSVIHVRSRAWNQRSLLLGAIYALSLILAWPVLLIGLLGVIEPWANLRGRPTAPPPTS